MANSLGECRIMIEDCRNRDSKLSAWDADFLDSIEVQLDGNNSLSDKQSDKLDEIWEKVTANG